MATHCTTEEEARKKYVVLMGESLGEVFYSLRQEVAMLHHTWNEYVALFGTGQQQVDLMNKAAPCFFQTVQVTFFRDTILRIARLTDEKGSGSKTNLSISVLEDVVQPEINGLEVSIEKANQDASFCREHRNKVLAHSDRKLATGKGAERLEDITREKISTALSSISEVWNLVAVYYDPELFTSFEHTFSSRGDGKALLHIVEKGLRRS
jgi:AbiU2